MDKEGSWKRVIVDGEEMIAECVWLSPLSNIDGSVNSSYIEKIDPETGKTIICRICYGVSLS